jgi:hypothetical protein
MLVVHLPDGLFDPVVVLNQSGVFRVRGFVEGVVPGYPGVGFVVLQTWRGGYSGFEMPVRWR